MSKLRLECGSDIQRWIIHWMSGRGAHTKNIPSHPIVVYHPYTWIHYSQYNNKYILYELMILILRIELQIHIPKWIKWSKNYTNLLSYFSYNFGKLRKNVCLLAVYLYIIGSFEKSYSTFQNSSPSFCPPDCPFETAWEKHEFLSCYLRYLTDIF